MGHIPSPALVWGYLALVNGIALALFGIDKRRAKRERWRIRESTLLSAALLGGAGGAWLGMRLFHHKTRKQPFRTLVPLLLALQLGALAWFFALP